ncbi:type IV secretion system DNA-binding domain-containing protein [Streptococcus pyogenes]|uniref:type IV secretion system DNA-binding domain-containing protein n=1 Tax=Streptococcus pyogenes TaxID=1314 RepID=UPI00109C5341|nr:type IV secretion system DNA-binding domain-containing protein [Streptococcus pyogenes]VHM01922.1 FtsK/SpoIIIE family [Streptococcus pyogenes]
MASQARDLLNQSFLQSYLLQSLNMALGASMQGETSYTNSFNIIIKENGFIFVPRLPCAYILDDELYKKIFLIANASLYPQFTLLKQNATYFVPLETDDMHIQRGIFFPWKKGISERLVIPDLDTFSANLTNGKIPIMKHFELNLDKVNHLAIAGNSGSGKSYALTYFLSVLKHRSDLIIIDPKFDTPSRWARKNNIAAIHPVENRSKSDFVSQVNEQLSQCVKLIQKRQAILYDNPNYKFTHLTIIIDQVLALSEGVNKTIKEAFFALLSQIALLGRATKIHLFLVSQRFDHNTIPISVREQLNVLLQIGNINQKTTQFLFPNLDPEGIVIPTGHGTGLIQVIDNEHPYQVLPLLCPTYYTKRGIL